MFTFLSGKSDARAPFDLGAERAQRILHVFITAVDVMDAADYAFALSAERRGDKRRSPAQIGSFCRRACQARHAGCLLYTSYGLICNIAFDASEIGARIVNAKAQYVKIPPLKNTVDFNTGDVGDPRGLGRPARRRVCARAVVVCNGHGPYPRFPASAYQDVYKRQLPHVTKSARCFASAA